MGRVLICGWLLVGALSACREIDIEPAGGGGMGGHLGGSPATGAANAGGAPTDGGSGGQAPTCETCGGDRCVDLLNDKNNCSVCGETCLQACQAGTCRIANDNARDVELDAGFVYWLGGDFVRRYFPATPNAPPELIAVASGGWFDLEVELDDIYLTDVFGPIARYTWSGGAQAAASCPADCNAAQVMRLVLQDGLGNDIPLVAWTSPSGVYVRAPDLAVTSTLPDPFDPAGTHAIGGVPSELLYAFGSFDTVKVISTEGGSTLTGFQNTWGIGFAGNTLFVADDQGLHCSAAPWATKQQVLAVSGAGWVETTGSSVLLTAHTHELQNTAPDLLVRVPGTCGGMLDPAEVEIIADAGDCTLGGIATDNDRVYWALRGDTSCAGVFSRRLDVPGLGTLADP